MVSSAGPLKIAIAGGSIGGLTAALLMRDDGHDVTVFERSSEELQQRGAGIGLLYPTYRYLVERGRWTVEDISVATERIRFLNRSGGVSHEVAHRYLFSSWNTLYRCLLERWRSHDDATGDDCYRLGSEVVGFDQEGSGVSVHLAGGRSEQADLLVFADGVGSTGRGLLAPSALPIYAGYVALRGMVHESALPEKVTSQLTDAITYHVFANSHILVYPIPGPDGSVEPGERLLNFVWYRNYLDGGDLATLLTGSDGQLRSLSVPPGLLAEAHVEELRATAVARLPPLLAEVVLAVEEPFVQVVYDIDVPRVARGSVCLIGDAAFAARPHAAAGSAKAADDAWTLAEAVSPKSLLGPTARNLPPMGVEDALAHWEPGRVALGRSLLERTRSIGRRSQVENMWDPTDPDLIFGLYGPGESGPRGSAAPMTGEGP